MITSKEHESLILIAEGYTRLQVARMRNEAYSTLSNRLSKLYRRLGVSTITQAVMVALQKGWIDA